MNESGSWRIFPLPLLLLLFATLLAAEAAFAELPGGNPSSLPVQQNIVAQGTPTVNNTATATVTCSPSGAWSIVPSPSNNGSLQGVAVVSSNDVWAVGWYLIEHWNGSTWSIVPSPSSGNLQGVAAVSSNDVWAVGHDYSSPENTLIEHWNGSTWSIVPSPNPGPGMNDSSLQSVAAVSSNDVWAVGYYWTGSGSPTQTLIERWNGSTWSIVPSPNPGTDENRLYGVAAVSSNDIWAVGWYRIGSGNNPYLAMTEHWDGSTWSIIPSPNPGIDSMLQGVAAVSSNDMWAVGFYENSSPGVQQTLIEHWNGSAWSVIPSPNETSQNFLYGVAAVSSSDVWAVGWHWSGNFTRPESLHWNGSAWSLIPMPDQGAIYNDLYGVAATSSNDVWAVGYHYDGTEYTLIEHHTASSCATNTPTRTNTSVPPTFTSTGVVPSNTVVPPTSTAISTSTPTSVIVTSTPTACTIRFADVPPSSPFYQWVRCLACRGIISGYPCGGAGEPCNPTSDPYFRPGNSLTRGQLARIVAQSAGLNQAVSGQSFEDVLPGTAFYTYTERLYAIGAIGGYVCGIDPNEPCTPPNSRPYYRPGASITRGQLTRIVSIAAGFVNPAPGTFTFTDVPVGSTFHIYVERLLLNRPAVMSGYPCGGTGEPCDDQNRPYFRPGTTLTRGQANKIVANTFFPGCSIPSRAVR